MNETEKKFKEELDALLKKYKVELSIEEEDFGYGSRSTRIEAFAYTQYDESNEKIADMIKLNLENYYTGD